MSVDTKKKELVGAFANRGRRWKRQGTADRVTEPLHARYRPQRGDRMSDQGSQLEGSPAAPRIGTISVPVSSGGRSAATIVPEELQMFVDPDGAHGDDVPSDAFAGSRQVAGSGDRVGRATASPRSLRR